MSQTTRKTHAANKGERFIVKVMNRKYPELVLSKKFTLSFKDFSRLNINNKLYANMFLCPYYRCLWGQCKYLQRREMVHHVFCLGSAVAIKLTEQIFHITIYHESDVPYIQSDDIAD